MLNITLDIDSAQELSSTIETQIKEAKDFYTLLQRIHSLSLYYRYLYLKENFEYSKHTEDSEEWLEGNTKAMLYQNFAINLKDISQQIGRSREFKDAYNNLDLKITEEYWEELQSKRFALDNQN